MKPIVVFLEGDVVIVDRLICANQGVLLFLHAGKVIFLPLQGDDATWVREHRSQIKRIDVTGGAVHVR